VCFQRQLLRYIWSHTVSRYKDAGEALRRKQDKEREAAGLPPVQRGGARGAAAAQRGQQRGGRGGAQRGAAPPARGGRGGGSAPRNIHTATDKNLYVHLLGHLKKKGLLPVVVFTFSKKRCEENAATLTNSDLCTAVEKSEVHIAIERALSRLKGLLHLNSAFPRYNNRKKVRTRNYLRSPGCEISSLVELECTTEAFCQS
jgi:superfamily II RNA helicase